MKIMVLVWFTMDSSYNIECGHVRDDPKLPGDSGEVPISEWSGWRFDSYRKIFSLPDKIK